jgi:hypothetical protein
VVPSTLGEMRMRGKVGAVLSAIAFLGATTPAAAITWRVTGEVNQIVHAVEIANFSGSNIAVGDPFEFDITFDPSATYCTLCFGPGATAERWAGGIESLTFRAGAWTHTITAQSDTGFSPPISNNEIFVADNNSSFGDEYGMSIARWISGPQGRGSSLVATWFAQSDLPTGDFLADIAVLSVPWELANFSYVNGPQMAVNLHGVFGPNITPSVSGTVASVALVTTPIAPVPENATWALMILGFASVGAMLRSCRRPVLPYEADLASISHRRCGGAA